MNPSVTISPKPEPNPGPHPHQDETWGGRLVIGKKGGGYHYTAAEQVLADEAYSSVHPHPHLHPNPHAGPDPGPR